MLVLAKEELLVRSLEVTWSELKSQQQQQLTTAPLLFIHILLIVTMPKMKITTIVHLKGCHQFRPHPAAISMAAVVAPLVLKIIQESITRKCLIAVHPEAVVFTSLKI
jgi:hypothetical protein